MNVAEAVLALRPYMESVRDDPLASLLKSAANGNARAFEAFYSATVARAMSLARRIAGDAWAEDVLAEAYFQAWREAERFDAARGNAIAWLLTITRSRALDRVRQESLRHAGSGCAGDEGPACDDPAPPDLLESLEARSRLHDLMAGLSPNERWVLGLAYFRDLTQTEVAQATGMPLGTVKSLILRAQHKLRDAFEIPLKS